MTKEETKAIRYLEAMNKSLDLNKQGFVYGSESIETALNLIQRQQEENIKLKQENENLKNREKHQSKEIKKAVDYTFELNAEIEKKDKTIDAMAKQLYIEGYCKEINCKKCNAENFANCIKQYFERKVEQ